MDMLRVFTTGGTIDKVYFDALSAYQVGEPAAAKVFTAMLVDVPFEITSLMRIAVKTFAAAGSPT